MLDERLRRQAGGLGEPSAGALAPIFIQLALEREEARARLVRAMTTPRYVALLDELVAAARAPRFAPGADRSARKVVPKLVARPWKKLRVRVRRLGSDPSPEDLHLVRIRAKRARYAAEAAVPLVGTGARRLARALADLQTVLGDHQDAVVAEEWLRRSIPSAEPAVQEAAEKLIAIHRAEAENCRRQWRPAWKKASTKRLRSCL